MYMSAAIEIKVQILITHTFNFYRQIAMLYYKKDLNNYGLYNRKLQTIFIIEFIHESLLFQNTFNIFQNAAIAYLFTSLNNKMSALEKCVYSQCITQIRQCILQCKQLFSKVKSSNEQKNIINAIDTLIHICHEAENICFLKQLLKDSSICIFCGTKTTVDPVDIILKCSICGYVIGAETQMQIDEYKINETNTSSKPGIFAPIDHFYAWIGHTTATESCIELAKLSESNIKLIEYGARNKRQNILYLTELDVRCVLKSYGLSKYNKHIPYLMKRISNIGPPIIPASIVKRSGALFIQVLGIMRKVLKKTNNKSYLYYIYKFFEHLLATPEHQDKLRILYYIHLQSKETLEKRDHEWKIVCKHLTIPWKYTSITYSNQLHDKYVKSIM